MFSIFSTGIVFWLIYGILIRSDSGEGRPETLSRDALFALRVEENQLGQIEH